MLDSRRSVISQDAGESFGHYVESFGHHVESFGHYASPVV